MSTVFSPATQMTGHKPVKDPAAASSLAAMLLAAAVAALAVVAHQLMEAWVDGHLFLGWVTLWVVVFGGLGMLAGSARRVARRAVDALDAWSRAQAKARAQARSTRLSAATRVAAKSSPMRTDSASQRAEPQPGEDFTQALAPLGMDADLASPAMLRRMAQTAMQRHSSYLPYL